jgi:hypothetical protein
VESIRIDICDDMKWILLSQMMAYFRPLVIRFYFLGAEISY